MREIDLLHAELATGASRPWLVTVDDYNDETECEFCGGKTDERHAWWQCVDHLATLVANTRSEAEWLRGEIARRDAADCSRCGPTARKRVGAAWGEAKARAAEQDADELGRGGSR